VKAPTEGVLHARGKQCISSNLMIL